jgi:molybdate transport system substrate-binding protein
VPHASGDANAVSVLSAGAMSEIVRELADAFERTTAIKVSAQFTRSGVVKDRVANAESFDVAITTQAAIDELAAGRHIVAGSAAVVARSGIGIAVRAGAPMPDVGSVEAFKQLLRSARSIAYADPATGSPSANYLVGLLDRLGMTAELKSKTHLVGASGGHAVVVCDIVARGEADIGIQQISEIVPVAGVGLAGPLPPDIQHMTIFSAAVASHSRKPDLAHQFVRYLVSDAARPAIAAGGMEPP